MQSSKPVCPSCKGTSTFKVSEGNYKCNYCQINFKAGDASSSQRSISLDDLKQLSKAGKFEEMKEMARTGQLDELKELAKKSGTQISSPAKKKVFLGCFISFIVMLAGIIAAVSFGVNSNSNEPDAVDIKQMFDSIVKRADTLRGNN